MQYHEEIKKMTTTRVIQAYISRISDDLTIHKPKTRENEKIAYSEK